MVGYATTTTEGSLLHEIQAKVLTVGSRPTKTGKLIYEVALSDGTTYTTFDNALAAQAQSLQGQDIQAQVDVRQNGQYTNYNIIALRPSLGAVQVTTSTGLPLAPAISPVPVNTGRGRDPQTEARIVRQSSLATAFKFIGHVYTGAGEEALAEAKAHALELAKELFGHAMGKPTEATPVPAAPAEVAAQVNEVLGGDAVAVGAKATPDW